MYVYMHIAIYIYIYIYVYTYIIDLYYAYVYNIYIWGRPPIGCPGRIGEASSFLKLPPSLCKRRFAQSFYCLFVLLYVQTFDIIVRRVARPEVRGPSTALSEGPPKRGVVGHPNWRDLQRCAMPRRCRYISQY